MNFDEKSIYELFEEIKAVIQGDEPVFAKKYLEDKGFVPAATGGGFVAYFLIENDPPEGAFSLVVTRSALDDSYPELMSEAYLAIEQDGREVTNFYVEDHPHARHFRSEWGNEYAHPGYSQVNGTQFTAFNAYDNKEIEEIYSLGVGDVWVSNDSRQHTVTRVYDLALYQAQFPDFGNIDISIPNGFVDSSWKNDASPSFELKLDEDKSLKLWIDYSDHEKSEVQTDDVNYRRFMLTFNDEQDCETDVLCRSNDMTEIREHIELKCKEYGISQRVNNDSISSKNKFRPA